MSLSREFSRRLLLRLAALVLILVSTLPAYAAEPFDSEDTEIWLVTYGPGEIYWQRFGHNAIWIRDRSLGLDHAFNFGFFDFEQENFLTRFLLGRMLYFSAARPAREEFAAYINENRSIRAQRLDLAPEQKSRLVAYLLDEVKPENRDYLYDYYLNNCSTRVRDAIDMALGGTLSTEFQSMPAAQTWRDHTRRLTYGDFWLYLGLEIGLASPVDEVGSRWDEMFIPEKLAAFVAEIELMREGRAHPLVVEDVTLFESTLDPPPRQPGDWWPLYLLASLAVVFGAWLLGLAGSPLFLARMWLLLSGLCGLALLFFWLGTDHAVARLNMNLMVLNPLWLLLAFWRSGAKAAALLIVGLSLFALVQAALPPHQYNLDVLAAFVPLNLAAALCLYRSRPAKA